MQDDSAHYSSSFFIVHSFQRRRTCRTVKFGQMTQLPRNGLSAPAFRHRGESPVALGRSGDIWVMSLAFSCPNAAGLNAENKTAGAQPSWTGQAAALDEARSPRL